MYRLLQTPAELKTVYPLMRQLRETLAESDFIERTQAAQIESQYELIGYFEGSECQALIGYRILTDLVHGRHLYVDDLVVDQRIRSKGVGATLLIKVKEIAREKKCKKLRLCTGTENQRGKNFYERNGWKFRAVVFKTEA
jgi:ribosomal protein S18 acetylase RimI-like enzyme